MIASLVIAHLQKTSRTSPDVGVSYLYCNYKKYGDQRPIDFLSALLKQLVHALPSIPDVVKALYDGHQRHSSRPSINEVVTTVRSVCDCYSNVFIIIDALDEYDNEQRKTLLTKLKSLRAPNVKMMVTSRPIPIIREEFEDALHLNIRAHREDIELFVADQIQHLLCSGSLSQDLKDRIISKINDVSGGM